MDVRIARPEEYDELGRITVEAYRKLSADDWIGSYEHELADVAGRAEVSVVLAAVGGDVVHGTVTYVPGPDTPVSEFSDVDGAGIRMLAVRPESQGSGAGRLLTEACVARARADGRQRIVLHSTELMAVARAMYERLGFARAPERDVWVTDDPYSEADPLHLVAFELVL